MRAPLGPLALTAIFLLAACGDTSEPDDANRGSFGFTMLQGLGDSGTETQEFNLTTEVAFELGDLKSSQQFYFLLRNLGDAAITDIDLAASGPGYSVVPAHLDALAPVGGGDGDFLPVVRVSINHGTALNGIGFTDLLAAGAANGGLAITGSTTDAGGAAEDVGLDVTLTATAKVMEVSIDCGGQALDLASSEGSHSSNLGGIGFVRSYPCEPPRTLTNTGNVPVGVSYARGNLVDPIALTVAPGDTSALGDDGNVTLVLDGGNTIADNDRLQIGNDGRAYFTLSHEQRGDDEGDEGDEEDR